MLTVQVEIAGRVRAITCRCELGDLDLGDRCLIDFEGRTHLARVVRVPLELPWEGAGQLPHVIRRAGQTEVEREAQLDAKRGAWLEIARQHADDLKLEMRFVRCEPHPSGNKVLLHFVAEQRVDFRQLVRDLAREFRARVELRQIGVRDAAILQGGIGHCGQQLCCARWLGGFKPVSMKMAKEQGLPLNPTKISGQCGRLMCCLRYELDGAAEEASGGGCGGGCADKKRPRPPASA